MASESEAAEESVGAETWMEDDATEGVQIAEYDITSSPNDFNVLTINNFLDSGAIIIPPYQRNYTWDKARASKLIDSLLLGLPVPQLFLYEESRNKFAILDGQQRLMSLYFFMKKRFPRKEKRMELREIFGEQGLFPPNILSNDEYFTPFNLYLPARGGEEKNKFDGLNYDTLEDYQSALNLRTIRCVIIKQNEPKSDNSSVFEIFDRLNTGGVNLKPQEIRSNLYYSKFYAALYEMNKDPRWRRIIGQAERDANLRDVELLLRAFAMLTYSQSYKPSMARFLNVFSSVAKKTFSDVEIILVKEIFDRFMDQLQAVNPSNFKLSDRFSIGVFEAAIFACAREAWDQKNPALVKPLTDNQVLALTAILRPFFQEGTSKTENVTNRLAAARYAV